MYWVHIMYSQELWLFIKKKDNVILRADGLLVNADKMNNHSINNNNRSKKEKSDGKTTRRSYQPGRGRDNTKRSGYANVNLFNVNPNDITQASKYNNSYGRNSNNSSSSDNRGNFRDG